MKKKSEKPLCEGGKFVKRLLIEKGWSRAELARQAGISGTHLNNIMRGIAPGTKTGKPRRIPDDVYDRIADALNTPREPLRKLFRNERPTDTPVPEWRELEPYFAEIPPAHRDDVISVVRILLKKYRQPGLLPVMESDGERA